MSRLRAVLELAPDGDDRWIAETPGMQRLFGGQVAAQALRAATLTVDPDRPVHSLHAYFIRGGKPGEPLHLSVDRTRDGRSFSIRHVTASQGDGPILTLSASFALDAPGDDWQPPDPIAEVPTPESIDPAASFFAKLWEGSPFDVRPVHPWQGEDGPPQIHPLWVRVTEPLPDDPGVHAALLAFVSDLGVVGSARAPSSTLPPLSMGASLDHAVWFHRPARLDDWILFTAEPASNASSRGLARCAMHDRAGRLVATVVQEVLLRNTGTIPLP